MCRANKECERHNGQDQVESAVCDMERAIHYEKIFVIVDAAPFVRHGSFRIMAHAAGARLMLAAAQNQSGAVTPHPFAAARAHPLFTARAHQLSSRHGCWMR